MTSNAAQSALRADVAQALAVMQAQRQEEARERFVNALPKGSTVVTTLKKVTHGDPSYALLRLAKQGQINLTEEMYNCLWQWHFGKCPVDTEFSFTLMVAGKQLAAQINPETVKILRRADPDKKARTH